MPPIYLTDQKRRVLANLSQPRSAPEVTRQIATDPYAPFDHMLDMTELHNQVSAVLRELEQEGLAKNLGAAKDAEAAVVATREESTVPTLHPEKAEQFVDRLGGKDSFKLREGDLWYFTEQGLKALTES